MTDDEVKPTTSKRSGPVFHENVAKVRITRTGPSRPVGLAPALMTTEFKGKAYDAAGEEFSPSELGWDHGDLAAAEADPGLVVERIDKQGRLVNRDGKRYPTVGELNPKPQPGGAMKES